MLKTVQQTSAVPYAVVTIFAGMMLADEEFLEIKYDFVAIVIGKLQEFAMFEAKTHFREYYFHPE